MPESEDGAAPTGLHRVESAWLAFARDVVVGEHHTAACVNDGGGCLEPGGSPGLRWPGFIGAGYRPGGLLLVGNIHRDFTSDGVPAWVSEVLVNTTYRLRADPVSHASQYLVDTRRAYLRGLTPRPGEKGGVWNVSRGFSHVLDGLGRGWDEVVYTNASKSQQVPNSKLDKVVAGCLEEWPIAGLARTLEASAVITCSALARDQLARTDVRFEAFPQRFSYARLNGIVEALRATKPGVGGQD